MASRTIASTSQLAKVTPGQIRAVARDFFRPDRLNLALVSPLKGQDRLENWLRL